MDKSIALQVAVDRYKRLAAVVSDRRSAPTIAPKGRTLYSVKRGTK